MKTTDYSIALSVSLAAVIASNVSGSSLPVSPCNQAALIAAVNAGGDYRFECDGTIVLSNRLVVAHDLILDANGHQVTISGGNAVGLFRVTSGVRLTVRGIALMNGRATNGAGLLNEGG